GSSIRCAPSAGAARRQQIALASVRARCATSWRRCATPAWMSRRRSTPTETPCPGFDCRAALVSCGLHSGGGCKVHEEFWQERWARNEIGFHLKEFNPYLRRHWSRLALAEGAQVLVPLCGKSLDLIWLAGQGLQVLGVELSERAVEAFFAEQGLQPTVTRQAAFRIYRCGSLEIR